MDFENDRNVRAWAIELVLRLKPDHEMPLPKAADIVAFVTNGTVPPDKAADEAERTAAFLRAVGT